MSRLLILQKCFPFLVCISTFSSCNPTASDRWNQYTAVYAQEPVRVDEVLSIRAEPWGLRQDSAFATQRYNLGYGYIEFISGGEYRESDINRDRTIFTDNYILIIAEPVKVVYSVDVWGVEKMDSVIRRYGLVVNEEFFLSALSEKPRTKNELGEMTTKQFELCLLFTRCNLFWCGFSEKVKHFSYANNTGYLLLPKIPSSAEIPRAEMHLFLRGGEYKQHFLLLLRNSSAEWNWDMIENMFSILTKSYRTDLENTVPSEKSVWNLKANGRDPQEGHDEDKKQQ